MTTMYAGMTIEQANEIINSYGGLMPLEVAEQRCTKLQKTYRSSGLCNTEYNELLRLDKAIGLLID